MKSKYDNVDLLRLELFLEYEICSRWWTQWIGNDQLQDWVVAFLYKKVCRKYDKYKKWQKRLNGTK